MDFLLILIGTLFACSVLFSKLSDKYGIPALLLFLAIGMLAGDDGFGIKFDNASVAADIGTIALIYILFSGGLHTDINQIRPVLARGLILATFGVVISAGLTAVFAYYILNLSILESALCGAIISSTDAAAVFSILRSKNIKLKNNLGELLEFESGSNDPMAIFLTMTIIGLATAGSLPQTQDVVLELSLQFVIGGLTGWAIGSLIPMLFNRINLSSSGLYPVLLLAIVAMLFGLTNEIGGNGYIAVYAAGIFANRRDFIYKKDIAGFFDGVAWIMQIFIFLTLGLLVFPRELGPVALNSMFLAVALMFVARPLSVFLCTILVNLTSKKSVLSRGSASAESSRSSLRPTLERKFRKRTAHFQCHFLHRPHLRFAARHDLYRRGKTTWCHRSKRESPERESLRFRAQNASDVFGARLENHRQKPHRARTSA